MKSTATKRKILSIIPSPILHDPDQKSDPHHPDAVRFDSSSMAMAALFLLLALFFLCFFSAFTRRLFSLFRRRDSRLHLSPPSPRPRRFLSLPPQYGIDPEVLQSLPVIKAKKEFKELGYCCVVCLSEFEETECVKIIPRCRHVFHPGCIDPWLLSRGSCPVCRCSDMLLAGSQSCSGLESFMTDEDQQRESSVGREDSNGEEEEGGGERKVMVLGRSSSWGHKQVMDRNRRVEGPMRRTYSF
ncbi:hypothetical protein LUZ60_006941 [Juncus effusus]|nr:hypothetical protein LUZ60_006941 [Juncus effusus]